MSLAGQSDRGDQGADVEVSKEETISRRNMYRGELQEK
jgi:hypothetical protein